eukprot:TRINITY_DN1859_c0_g1_i1.p1 TRINITY_DN1859_c0_g1~~TRINITY_DN1859_c0_g1_i1.p1  ORF type:complete len:588 (+),score=76.81 TRINITY_DN1859_c0_g1_i1:25-1788(+)
MASQEKEKKPEQGKPAEGNPQTSIKEVEVDILPEFLIPRVLPKPKPQAESSNAEQKRKHESTEGTEDPTAKRARGLNKARPVATGAKSERPSCEGEVNFFTYTVRSKVRAAAKALRAEHRQQMEGRHKQGKKKGKQAEKQEKPSEEKKAESASTEVKQQDSTTENQGDQTTAPTSTEQAEKAAPVDEGKDSVTPMKEDAPTTTTPTTEQLKEEAAAGTETFLKKKEKKKVDFRGKSYLAPLTTLGNLPFRRITKRFGADITIGEMAMVPNLLDCRASEWSLLRKHESEDCFGLQLAVASAPQADTMARMLEESGFQYDFVDINCGCPVDIFCQKGVGSALLDKKGRLASICKAFAKHLTVPLTIKVRVGKNAATPVIHKWTDVLQDWGVDAWTIHGRGKLQRYKKLADWNYIDTCAKAAQIPTIGNGDVFQWDTYWNTLDSNAVQGIMIGRAALIKPWIFTEIKEKRIWDISATERLDMLKDFCKFGENHWGSDEKGLLTTRRFLCEWLSFLCRYVPAGICATPQQLNLRPPPYKGRNDLETLMASKAVKDWVKISELVLGPAPTNFTFTPKHKSASYEEEATAGEG